jgi:pimeloyl-ACP methyl ester carboxylesterase
MTDEFRDGRTQGPAGIAFERSGAGETAVLFIHGFLGGGIAWDSLIAESATRDVELARFDIAGMGDRVDDDGPFSLERFTEDAVAVIDELDKPVTIVGHSMGSQIAELAAARRPGAVRGLVFIAPIPLTGTRPGPGQEPTAIDAVAVRTGSIGLFGQLGDPGKELIRVAEAIRTDTLWRISETFAGGHPDGELPSRYVGPVLLLPGTEDTVVSPAVVEAAIAPRFSQATTVPIAHASHYPHLEQPRATAAAFDAFVRKLPRRP